MTDANQIRKVFERYPELISKGDWEGIVALYADDASIEDPIGSDLRVGRDAIRSAWPAARRPRRSSCSSDRRDSSRPSTSSTS